MTWNIEEFKVYYNAMLHASIKNNDVTTNVVLVVQLL